MGYAQHVAPTLIPQTEPLFGREKEMVKNSAGGFTFQVDCWERLHRFLILGSQGGSYYANEKKLTQENASCIQECIAADPLRTVNTIVQISDAGRAPKNDPAVFALALCASSGNDQAAKAALESLNSVCRIGTHLFQFVEAVNSLRGWGPALRKAVGKWYSGRSDESMAFQVTKYQQRNGWSHRDVLRLSHPKLTGLHETIGKWAVGKVDFSGDTIERMEEVADYVNMRPYRSIVSMELAKRATTKQEIVRLVEKYKIVRECIPTQWLNEPEVWDAMLDEMPLTAMVRNLGKMSSIGLLKPLSKAIARVTSKLGDAAYIRKSRLHPLSILVALKTYASGHGDKGSLTWNAVPQVIDALNEAFYMAFDNVEPTGKRWLLACDVSGSMGSGISGMNISCREAVAALSLVTMRTEKQCHILGFGHSIVNITISPSARLDHVCEGMSRIPFGSTDCSLPMLWAAQNNIDVDMFVVLTDNETYAGRIHPNVALQQYRQKSGLNAKMAVIGMVANNFTIADPKDAGMMDFVGFDTAVPQVLADFAIR